MPVGVLEGMYSQEFVWMVCGRIVLNMAFTLKGYIKVPLEELETIEEQLDEHIQNTKKEVGCIEFRVEQSSKNECIFNVFETFVDRDAFDLHQDRVHTSSWGSLTENVERVYEVEELGN
jgi:quinol monooxygenase YgiN